VRRNGRAIGVAAFSIAGHLAVGLTLLAAVATPKQAYDPQPVTVALVDLPALTPAPLPPQLAHTADASTAPTKTEPAPTAHVQARLAPPTPTIEAILRADKAQVSNADPGLSEAALAGAATADSGDGGGGCNMARRLEDDLKRDQLVQTAVASFSGKAMMVWDGDWVWIDGEDGKGLTAVRQAMMWDIAFAPKPCRAQTMHGLVVINANPAHGAARLVVGGATWRWSDLLVPHPGAGSRLASR
jgi:hypothetical protein